MILWRVLKVLGVGAIGAIVALVSLGIYVLNKKPELKVWHLAELDEEFTASSEVTSFQEYQELEDRLFAQLDMEVYQQIDEVDRGVLNRYHRGSLSDPGRWEENWNRSYELVPDSSTGTPGAGVLLIHGLSDSPYSLRTIGQRLHAERAHVVGLRVPGHGTAPVALTRTTWQDMSAAVILAVKHLRRELEDQPLYVVGYSNGGALAVHYALSTLEDAGLPAIDGLALISPEIGVSPMAAMAIWQERIGRVLGLEKLAWQDIQHEFEPFKYSSFPVQAGNLAYEITKENREKIERLAAANSLGDFPPVLAFQSAVDATVSAPDLVRDFFSQLPENRHELVAFDVNRRPVIEKFLRRDPAADIGLVLDHPERRFVFSVLTNASADSELLVVRRWGVQKPSFTEKATELKWPPNIYSLSHVALPFPPQDPVYGGAQADKSPGIHLGSAALRGERGALAISAANMMRLRWNPFYSYLEDRIVEHCSTGTAETGP